MHDPGRRLVRSDNDAATQQRGGKGRQDGSYGETTQHVVVPFGKGERAMTSPDVTLDLQSAACPVEWHVNNPQGVAVQVRGSW
jgi:hypothetical protein